MARREYYHTPQCVHEGCTKRAYYVFSTRADQRAEMESLHRRGGWRCTRHTKPDEVLMPSNSLREQVLVSVERFSEPWRAGRRVSIGYFWAPEGSENGGSGFVFGPGFKAYTEDFPPGTRLIVSARVELPTSDGAPAEAER